MPKAMDKVLKEHSPYSAVITREQFLFHEMRITAKLLNEDLDKDSVINKITSENLFQYPTEKSLKRMAITCIKRLEAMEDDTLIDAIAVQPNNVAKQICLYAMMRQYRLVWDFMLTVIGDKYKKFDNSYSKMDLNIFFIRLQEQDSWVASWSDSTITKIRQVLTRILIDNEYLDGVNADHLNPVLINPVLENSIRSAGKEIALPAFNCLM
ncbi:MAG: DUF1819 family protein [Firmicutes bacterium]|nr:DUF1819 family protein [Bacillota bacterium]